MTLPDDLRQAFRSKAAADPGFAIAAAIADLADAQREVAQRLAVFGPIDLIVAHHAKAVDSIASSIETLGSDINFAMEKLTTALEDRMPPDKD